jgi:transposase
MRIATPISKFATTLELAEQYDRSHDLDAIYRMMDAVNPLIDSIKQRTFASTCALFPEGVDLLLFDVTTLYFESVETDELRAFGYSKDCRFNTTQVVLALATNGDGLPIGYELFAGNQAEVGTLVQAIEHWKTLFKIDNICFVGDRAMFSEDNMALLERHRYDYVVACKLKSLPKPLIAQILDPESYHCAEAEPKHRIGEFTHHGRRLVVSYKAERATKDKKDRDRLVEKTKKRLGKNGTAAKLISNHGVRSVTRIKSADAELNQDKIAAAAQWDGLHGILTNIQNQDAAALLARYARLWVIEASFRINKHNLKMRPIFHWKKERIEAHVALCYMAFAVVRHLE